MGLSREFFALHTLLTWAALDFALVAGLDGHRIHVFAVKAFKVDSSSLFLLF